jgi:DNA-binding beta-propeller fold protein YncE
LAADDSGNIYVADRSNSRIQKFDGEGRFLAQWKRTELGRPYGLDVGPDGRIFSVDGGDQPDELPDRSRALRLSPDGSIEAIFGRFGNYDGQFNMGHDIAVGADGAVYVVDILGARVQKFVPR